MDTNDNDDNTDDDQQASFMMNCDEINLVYGEIKNILRKERDILNKMTTQQTIYTIQKNVEMHHTCTVQCTIHAPYTLLSKMFVDKIYFQLLMVVWCMYGA